MTNQTIGERYLGVTHYVTVLTTAIDGTSDTFNIRIFPIHIVCRSSRVVCRIVDINLRRTDVCTEHIVLVVTGNTLTSAIHITIVCKSIIFVISFEAQTSTFDGDMRCTFKRWCIFEMVWPTQGKTLVRVVCITMLMEMLIDIRAFVSLKEYDVFILNTTLCDLFHPTVNDTYRSHLTTAIDALSDITALDVNKGILTHTTSKEHRCKAIGVSFIISGNTWIRIVVKVLFGLHHRKDGSGVIVFTTITTTIDIASDGWVIRFIRIIRNGDSTVCCSRIIPFETLANEGTIGHCRIHLSANHHTGVITNGTQLSTSIHILPDDSITIDIDSSGLHHGHLGPYRIRSASQKLQSSHRTTEHVTACSVNWPSGSFVKQCLRNMVIVLPRRPIIISPFLEIIIQASRNVARDGCCFFGGRSSGVRNNVFQRITNPTTTDIDGDMTMAMGSFRSLYCCRLSITR